MPPDLGDNSVALVNGSTFLLSAPNGDVPSGSIGGLVHLDTRLLSRWVLRINGTPLLALRSDTVDTYSAQFFVTNPPLPGVREDTVAARRLRYLGDGLHERMAEAFDRLVEDGDEERRPPTADRPHGG